MHLFVYGGFLYARRAGVEASYFRASGPERREPKTRGIYLELLIAIRIIPSVRSESFLRGAKTREEICSVMRPIALSRISKSANANGI